MEDPDNGQIRKMRETQTVATFLTNPKGHFLRVRQINRNKLYKILYEPNMKLS